MSKSTANIYKATVDFDTVPVIGVSYCTIEPETITLSLTDTEKSRTMGIVFTPYEFEEFLSKCSKFLEMNTGL